MHKGFLKRVLILALGAIVIVALGIAAAMLVDSQHIYLISVSVLGLWFLICAIIFARHETDKHECTAVEKPSPIVETIVREIAPEQRELVTKNEVKREFSQDVYVRDCRMIISELSALSNNGETLKAAHALIKDVERSLDSIKSAEASLRKAVRMCEDVTSEVYILSVLANVEVGAHADSKAGFEVIAQQIQPLAESGSMAAIEAKASIDGAFGPIKSTATSVKRLLYELLSDEERRKKLISKLSDAERVVNRLAESVNREVE